MYIDVNKGPTIHYLVILPKRQFVPIRSLQSVAHMAERHCPKGDTIRGGSSNHDPKFVGHSTLEGCFTDMLAVGAAMISGVPNPIMFDSLRSVAFSIPASNKVAGS